jgi:hypothetical protein
MAGSNPAFSANNMALSISYEMIYKMPGNVTLDCWQLFNFKAVDKSDRSDKESA